MRSPRNLSLSEIQTLLKGMVPDIEVPFIYDTVEKINALKKSKNAVVLGHNYMEPAVYHLAADIRGDSLELCRAAAKTDAEIIVFCGVEFMAETAKILNPQKKVLVPSDKAGCSLAGSITGADVRALKERFPGVPVVCYINTYAEVKAECDICCTSGNAEHIISSLKSDTIIFVPDEYLAGNVARSTGKHIIVPKRVGGTVDVRQLSGDYEIVSWPGKCEVHEQFTVADIEQARSQYPDIAVLAHPECSPEVVAASDFSGSTSAMIKYVRENKKAHFLCLTECAMGDNIAIDNPDKELVRLCSVRCPHMKTITLKDTLNALVYERYEVMVPEEIRLKALRCINNMLNFS